MKTAPFIAILGMLMLGLSHPKKQTAVSAELQEELSEVPLIVKGTIPEWLSGTLTRNGPVNVTVNGETNPHWFDGLAMLHAFSFKTGTVTYTNKFLRTHAYSQVFEKGSLKYDGFAEDPCRSLFKRFFTWLIPHRDPDLPNANVNVAKLAEAYVALTETPLPVQFDPHTLETLGVLDYQDHLPRKNCWESAHPHDDPNAQQTLNYLIQFGRHSYYTFYHIPYRHAERRILTRIPVEEPAYMHSFAITENYIILTEFPFVVKPLDLMLKGKAFIKNFQWHPERGTQFIVISRKNGDVIGKYKTKPFFAFHHANAYEAGDTLRLDIVTYPDAEVIMGVAEHYRQGHQEGFIKSKLDRFTLSLSTGEITCAPLLTDLVEFPRIHDAYDGKPYTYVYLINPENPTSPTNLRPIYKVNTQTRETLKWSQEGCYPGEPVFVPTPNSPTEDDGVILAVVFDHTHHSSFLLVLDAKTMQEIGRAEVAHVIPVGLHGQYFKI